VSAVESSQKHPSAASVNSQCPVGCDSAKKVKTTDFIIDKVVESVAKAITPETTQVSNTSSMKNIEEGLAKANEIMQSMANHQVMSMALSEMKDHYFSEVFDLINKQSRNKKLRHQMENEKMLIHMKN
jgi:hypothetical protein